MRQVNVRFLVGVIVCVLLLAGSVHALHIYQYGRQATALKRLIDSSKESSSLSDRIDHLRRYTALVQNDAASLDELGKLLLEAGRFPEATQALATAVNLYKAQPTGSDDKVVDLRRKLIEAAFAIGRLQDAEFQLNELIVDPVDDREAHDQESRQPAQSEYREQLATIYVLQAKWPEADEQLKDAVKLDPTRCRAYGLRADIQADQFGAPDDAAKQLDKMVAANPEDARAYRLRGAFRLRQLAKQTRNGGANPATDAAPATGAAATPGETWDWTREGLRNDALADAKRALELAPDDRDVLLLAMQCEFQYREGANDQADAAAHLTEAAKLARRVIAAADREFEERLGKIEAELRARDEAKRKRSEDAAAVKVSDANRLALQNAVYGTAAAAYNVLAAVALSENRSADAMIELREGLKKTPANETLLLNLASLQIAAESSAERKAVQDLIATLETQPNSQPLADYLDARVSMADGQFDLGLDRLLTVRDQLDRWPDIAAEADLSIGRCRLRLGEPRKAEEAFRRVQVRRPDSVPAMLGLATALQQIGDPQELEDAQSIYAELSRRSAGISGADKTVVALQYVRLLRTRYAGLPAENKAWTTLLLEMGRLRQALGSSRESATEMDLLEAEVQLARGRRDAAEELLSASVDRDPQSARLWAALALIRTRPAGAAAGANSEKPDEPGDGAADGTQAAGADRAIETFREAESAIVNPTPDDRVVLQLARARHCLMTKLQDARPELEQMAKEALAADDAIKQSLAASPDSSDLQIAQAAQMRLIEALGNLTLLIDDVPSSSDLYERLRASDPKNENLSARLVLFDLELRRRFDPELSAEALAKLKSDQIEKLNSLLKEIKGPGQRELFTKYGTAIVDLLKADLLPDDKPESRTTKIGAYQAAHEQLGDIPRLGRVAQRMLFLDGEILDRKYQLERINDEKGWKVTFGNTTARYQDAFKAGYRAPEFIFKLLRYLHLNDQDDLASKDLLNLGEQAPNLVETVQTTATIANTLGNPADLMQLAQAYAQRVVEAPGGEKDPVALLTYGQILAARGELDAADEVFDRVRKLSSSDLQLWLTLARGYRQINAGRTLPQPNAADSNLKQKFDEILASAEPALNKSDFGLLKANMSTMQGDVAEARARFDAALADVPSDLHQATADQIRLLAGAGMFFIRQPAATDAESVAKGEAILNRLDDEGWDVFLELREARRKRSAAEKISDEERQLAVVIAEARRLLASRKMGQSDSANLTAALAYITRNKVFGKVDADRRIEALIKSRMPGEKNHSDAIGLLESVIGGTTQPEPSDRLLVATMHLAEYQAVMQEVGVKERADGAAAVAELKAKAEREHLQVAEDHVRAIELAGPPANSSGQTTSGTYAAALMQLIEIQLLKTPSRARDAEVYVDRLKAVIQGTPSAAMAAVVEARVRFAEGNQHEKVRELLLQLIAGTPEASRTSAMTTVAQLLEGFGAQIQAKAETQQSLNGPAASPKPGESEKPVDLADASPYFKSAENLLQQLSGNSLNDRLSLAGFYGRRGRTDEALRMIEQDIGSAPPAAIASACAQVMKGGGRESATMQHLGTVLTAAREQHPDALPLKLLQADLKAFLGDASTAETLYREVLASSPTDVVAANNLAYLLATQKRQLDEALKLMDELIARLGKAPDLLDTRAFVRLQRGEAQDALRDLSEVVDTRPRPAFLLHQAQAQLAAGQIELAKATWRRAESAGLTEEGVHPAERDAYLNAKSQLDSAERVTSK